MGEGFDDYSRNITYIVFETSSSSKYLRIKKKVDNKWYFISNIIFNRGQGSMDEDELGRFDVILKSCQNSFVSP